MEAITMSKTVTLELSDEVYEAAQETAAANGKPLEEWIVGNLPQFFLTREALEMRLAIRKAKEETIDLMAAKLGRPREEIAAEWRAKYGPQPLPQLTEEERQAAWERLRPYMGAVDSGDPDSSNNERIDA